jgi:glycosyltransferase involved in cell wall biosynthesis/SAM-dependent methyltransferase
MEIAIVSGGMATGPDTLQHYSLGGSETAALSMAKELSARGHMVQLFCNLPQPPRLDAITPGHIGQDGVKYSSLDGAGDFLVATEVDLLIASRNPGYTAIPHQAKKAVLWMHDLAVYGQSLQHLHGSAWCFDEIWCVSEYHRQQVHKVTGYPLDKIWATRNGITKQTVHGLSVTFDRTLLYAARPERGLLNLVRPGGVMDHLSDFHLNVCTYDNYPPHMEGFYKMVFGMCAERKNVTVLPPQTQGQLRQLMKETWAYVYPTQFEEVSCIIAREAIEQHLPFFTTTVGALPESLGASGIFYDCPRDQIGDDNFCEGFANLVKKGWETRLEVDCLIERAKAASASRTDLYWDEVAKDWEGRGASPVLNLYSHVRSMIEDSDIIPAIALLKDAKFKTQGVRFLEKQIEDFYPYLFGRESFHDYYARYYELEDFKGARGKPHMEGNPRFETIAAEIGKLPAGTRVLDYGCAEGVICNTLARRFPDKTFVAVDFNDGNISLASKYATEDGLGNIEFHYIRETDEIASLGGGFGAAICSEVLEHVTEPWALIDRLEQECVDGARIITTTPAGPWEATGLYSAVQFPWRAHIWHVDKWMCREMFSDKGDLHINSLFQAIWDDGRSIGHTVCSFNKNGVVTRPVDPLEKAMRHRCRQTAAAALIAKNAEGEIKRCLDTISKEVTQVQIALGPCTDHTVRDIMEWEVQNPWVEVRIKHVPAIEARKFGFDDARNASIEGLEADWIFWVDTDEYVSGSFKKYLTNNAFDSYAIHQHHFTVEPRGAPAQMDKPARLFRNNGQFSFFGKVHEHAEKGFNEGPGFTMIMSDVDIGHTGYVNETVRKKRFFRNFPFLEWDREVMPDRKLGMFLWLRDLIHLMREHASRGDTNGARALAQQAISFFNENAERFQYIGNGVQQSLDYLSEARASLGIGSFVQIQVAFPNEKIQTGYHGIFDNPEEALKVANRFLSDDFERRKSGYWQ